MTDRKPMQVPLPLTPVLETQRLILRPLEARDTPAIQRIFGQWEVVRFLLAKVPWPYPDDGAATNMAECLAMRARGEQFYWAITLKATTRWSAASICVPTAATMRCAASGWTRSWPAKA